MLILNIMKNKAGLLSLKTIGLLISVLFITACGDPLAQTRESFVNADDQYRPYPLWFWNNSTVTKEGVREQMKKMKELSGYAGVGILPFGRDFKPEYLSDEYFDIYGEVIRLAKELNMKLWLYDEYGFPSGSIGYYNGDSRSRFVEKYPEFAMKSLFKTEYNVRGNSTLEVTLPAEGQIMSVVALDTVSKERIDLTDKLNGYSLSWKSPKGQWKVIAAICKPDGEPLLDYMDEQAAIYFTEMTHHVYYEHFKDAFGEIIVGSFFDEPTLYRMGGRNWTPRFNEKFQAKHGFSPTSLYPALWYDIGEQTREARNYLFGMRTDLYAEGYTKVVSDWSTAHNIRATGHQDNEEIVNPVGTSGDLMKCFKYLDIPGIDKIGGSRPTEKFYKVVSSAAYNWDKSFVMSETYGDMGDISWETIYSVAMDQYTKGINVFIPHAVWYNDRKVTFKPELSYRSPKYGDGLYDFTTFVARLNVLLANEGRIVNNVAVYYPIEAMQGEHYFDGPLHFYRGGVEIPDMDYAEVGYMLSDTLGRDYTFIHPEVLNEKCKIQAGSLRLDNQIQWNNFDVLIFPSCKTISLNNLQKAVDFYHSGGTLVFTTQLPAAGTKAEDDARVKTLMSKLFPDGGNTATDKSGGKAYFLRQPSSDKLGSILNGVNGEIQFNGSPLRNMTKEINGKKVYYFANPTSGNVSTSVALNKVFEPELWNPHTGTIEKAQYTKSNGKVTVDLQLQPYTSVFVVEP